MDFYRYLMDPANNPAKYYVWDQGQDALRFDRDAKAEYFERYRTIKDEIANACLYGPFPPKEENMQKQTCPLCLSPLAERRAEASEHDGGFSRTTVLTFECGTTITDHDCPFCHMEGAADTSGPRLTNIGDGCIKRFFK